MKNNKEYYSQIEENLFLPDKDIAQIRIEEHSFHYVDEVKVKEHIKEKEDEILKLKGKIEGYQGRIKRLSFIKFKERKKYKEKIYQAKCRISSINNYLEDFNYSYLTCDTYCRPREEYYTYYDTKYKGTSLYKELIKETKYYYEVTISLTTTERTFQKVFDTREEALDFICENYNIKLLQEDEK